MFTFQLPLYFLRWLHAGSSNMAVLEVPLLSGFRADIESLERVRLFFYLLLCILSPTASHPLSHSHFTLFKVANKDTILTRCLYNRTVHLSRSFSLSLSFSACVFLADGQSLHLEAISKEAVWHGIYQSLSLSHEHTHKQTDTEECSFIFGLSN